MARRAGRKLAMAAMSPSSAQADASSSGSFGLMPNNNDADAAAGQQRQSKACHDAKEHQLSGFAHDQAEHVEPPGAERDAHADLRTPLRNDVRQHAVEADDGQRDREHAEESRQHRQQPFADESIANARLEDRELDNRSRITLPELLSDPRDGHIRRHARVNHDVGARALARGAANRDRTPSAAARRAGRCTGCRV